MSLDEHIQGNNVLLTNVKVRKTNVDNKTLQLTFRGLSDMYVRHLNTYCSVPLTWEDANKLADSLRHPELDGKPNPFYEYSDSVDLVRGYFNIVQFRGPTNQSEAFKKLKLNGSKKEFQLGREERGRVVFAEKDFDLKARWNIGYGDSALQPGTIYEVDQDHIKSMLLAKRSLDIINLENTRRILQKYGGKVRPPGFISKLVRVARSESSLEEEFQKSPHRKLVDDEVNYMGLNQGMLESQLRNWMKDGDKLVYHEGSGTYRLFVDKRPNFERIRKMSPEEWMALTYLMVDIETPKFLEGDDEITQISASIVKDKKIRESRVYNTVSVSLEEIKGQKVISGLNEKEAIQDLSLWSLINEVDVLMAYNNNFDFTKMRERGDFNPGVNATPKKDVTMSFFERFQTQGGFSLDLMRIGQTILRGYPNSKLVTFSKLLHGEKGYSKEISYQEMYELQLLSEGKKVDLSPSTRNKLTLERSDSSLKEKAAKMILSYVADDVNVMPEIYFHPIVQECVKSALDMAEYFQLDPARVLTSPNSLREVFDRGYFKHVGLQRSSIYPEGIPFFKKEVDRNSEALKKHIDSRFRSETVEGVVQGLERRFIPASMMMRQYSHKATSTVQSFMQNIADKFENGVSPHELIFLSRYADGLLGYIVNNVGGVVRKDGVYEEIMSHFEHALPRSRKINLDGLSFRVLEKVVEQGYFGYKPNLKITLQAIKKLEGAEEFASAIMDKLPELEKTLEANWITNNDLHSIFWDFFRSMKQRNRVEGQTRMNSSSLLKMVNDNLDEQIQTLNHTHQIMHVDYPWVYTLPQKEPYSLRGGSVTRCRSSCHTSNKLLSRASRIKCCLYI